MLNTVITFEDSLGSAYTVHGAEMSCLPEVE
jgi:hypothetical protein